MAETLAKCPNCDKPMPGNISFHCERKDKAVKPCGWVKCNLCRASIDVRRRRFFSP